MALNLGELTAYLSVDSSSWQKGFADAQEKMRMFSDKVPSWMGGASVALLATTALAVAGLYNVGAAWDDVTDTIRVGTGAQGEALDGLVDSAKEVAKQVPVELDKIGPAIADVNTRLGLTGDTLETVAAQFLEASRMLGEDVDINAASGALNAFQIAGEDVSGALDYMFQVSQGTGVSMNDLAAKLSAAAPITQQLGMSFEETAAMIGSMDKAGLDSQSMIGAMQRGLAQMTQPGEDASATFQRVVGDIEGFIAAGDEASARAVASEMFGTRGAAQFVGALQSGAINMDDFAASAGLTGDTILGAAADTQDFAEKWQLVKNRASAALEPLASTVFDALGDTLDKIMPYLESFTNWLAENPAMVQIIAAAFGVLTIAVIGLTIATWAMNTALLANPITWIVLAVVALIAAIVLLVMNWDAVVSWLKDVWGGFVDWIVAAFEWYRDMWVTVWTAIIDFFKGIWQAVVDWFVDMFTRYIDMWKAIIDTLKSWWEAAWNGITGFYRKVWDTLISWARTLFTNYVNFWRGLWDGIVTFFVNIWGKAKDGVTEKFTAMLDFMRGIPDTIKGFFSNVGSWLYNAGRDLVQGMIDGVKSLAGKVGEFFLDKLPSWIVGPFKSALGINSPSRVFKGYAQNTVQGYLDGLDGMQGKLDSRMSAMIDTSGFEAASTLTGSSGSTVIDDHSVREFTYVAAENRSLSSEEDLFEALASPRGKGQ